MASKDDAGFLIRSLGRTHAIADQWPPKITEIEGQILFMDWASLRKQVEFVRENVNLAQAMIERIDRKDQQDVSELTTILEDTERARRIAQLFNRLADAEVVS
ncbi:MAG TPA: hypothetical protein VNH21_03120 [Steroidobacteraceae bacterium]|nr:hypothetical protein [Steroidobacteraceae bacterium]